MSKKQIIVKIKRKLGKYNNLLLESIFNLILKKRIDNDILIEKFYKYFSMYQYIDQKLYVEPEFKDEKNHYIPRFVLNNFKISSNPGQIYQYEKLKNLPKKGISIRGEAANIVNYYVSYNLIDGKPSNYIEKKLFAELTEKLGDKVIKSIFEHPNQSMISVEENIVSTYTALQYSRTPAFQEQLKVCFLYLLEEKKVPREVFSNASKNEFISIFKDNSFNIKDKELRDYYEVLLQKGVDIDKSLSTKLDNSRVLLRLASMTIGVAVIKLLFDKEKTLIEATDPYYFVLPDSGVIIIDIDDPFRWPFGWELNKLKTIICLPLSPQKCLIFHNLDMKDNTLKEYIRNLAIGGAYQQYFKFLYSDRKDIYIQRNVDKF